MTGWRKAETTPWADGDDDRDDDPIVSNKKNIPVAAVRREEHVRCSFMVIVRRCAAQANNDRGDVLFGCMMARYLLELPVLPTHTLHKRRKVATVP